MMIKIYHNNRCSKSRNGIKLLEDSGKEFKVINYVTEKLSINELENIIKLLGIKPIELVRKNEAIWKEHYKGKELTDAEIINAMVENPKLIERPIVVNGKNAVIGRPSDNILKII